MADEENPVKRGNWEEKAGWNRTLQQVWEIAFQPELEKRRLANLIDEQFQVYSAQWLMPPEGDNSVFFNEEVRGVALLRAAREVTEGDPVLISDLANIEKFDLPDDLLDCGHFTIFWMGEGWNMTFNFRSGRAKARDMLKLATEFLEAAQTSASKGHGGPAVDNLFSASELVCKAELILHRSSAVKSKKHGPVASGINNWAKLGNIDMAFVALFNRLGQQRPNARYGDSNSRPPLPSFDDFELVKAMIDRGIEIVSPSVERTC